VSHTANQNEIYAIRHMHNKYKLKKIMFKPVCLNWLGFNNITILTIYQNELWILAKSTIIL